MVRLLLLATVLLVGCNGPTSGPRPTPVASATPGGPLVNVSGRVFATVTGEPLGGIRVEIGGRRTTTAGSGAFAFAWDAGTQPDIARVTLTGAAILPRTLTIGTATSRELTLDAIVLGSGFDLDYYRRLVRDTADAPDIVRPLRRWTRAPRIYLSSVDEAGQPIDEATLSSTEAALRDDAAAWTGGRFGVAEVLRGASSRQGQSGWITVKWPNPANEGNNCGRAQVGVEGGWIELNYLNPNCACAGSRMAAGVVRHELGHALGFYHTDEPSDLMQSSLNQQTLCNGRASARERFHAAIAYSRPVGNIDPDTDPATTIQRHDMEPIVIVD